MGVHRYNPRPMSRRQERLPLQIDPFRLAEARRVLEGRIALRHMKRLASALSNTEGEIEVSLEFGIDNMGVPFVSGALQANLSLICQRCLEEMNMPVETELALGFVRSSVEAEAMIGPYEPYIVESVPVDLMDIIEDEILLSLPQIPMHPFEECPARELYEQAAEQGEQENEVSRESPFHVLAGLKTPKKGK